MNKALVAVIPVVLIGVVAGLGFSGVVNIPGLTPKKAVKNAADIYEKDKGDLKDSKPKKVAEKPVDPPPVVPQDDPKKKLLSKQDPELGAQTLAAVWNEVKTPQLIRITKDWKDADLAKVLAHMDTDKVAKLLDALAKGDPEEKVDPNPVRASKISKVLRDQGSIVKGDQKTDKTT